MNKHTIGDLYQMQSLPLAAKIRMTEYRIRQWVDYYGENGVYVGFSGGKDSTVLLHMIRKIYQGGVKRYMWTLVWNTRKSAHLYGLLRMLRYCARR